MKETYLSLPQFQNYTLMGVFQLLVVIFNFWMKAFPFSVVKCVLNSHHSILRCEDINRINAKWKLTPSSHRAATSSPSPTTFPSSPATFAESSSKTSAPTTPRSTIWNRANHKSTAAIDITIAANKEKQVADKTYTAKEGASPFHKKVSKQNSCLHKRCLEMGLRTQSSKMIFWWFFNHLAIRAKTAKQRVASQNTLYSI